MQPDKSFFERFQPRFPAQVILREPGGVALDSRVKAQNAMLQGIGVQFGQNRMDHCPLHTQPMDLHQQLQQVGQRVELLQGLGPKLKAGRPVQRAATSAVGVENRRYVPGLRQLRRDVHQAHVIALVPLKIAQRLYHLIDQPRRVLITGKHALQPLHTKQLIIRPRGVDNAVRE